MKIICVLGSSFTLSNEGFLNNGILKDRLEKAYEIWLEKFNKDTFIIVSGCGNNKFRECMIMKSFLLSLGVPDHYIIQEAQSMSTIQNIFFCKKIIDEINKAEGFLYNENGEEKYYGSVSEINIVTSDFHILRTSLIVEKLMGIKNIYYHEAKTKNKIEYLKRIYNENKILSLT